MDNINFIFKSLNKKKVIICLLLEILLDIIYYIVPFAFTLFLTLPFTIKKALTVLGVFMISKSIRVVGNYVLSIISNNYLYEYEKVQYKEFYKKLSKLPVETISKYQTGYFENIISKVTDLVGRVLTAEYFSIVIAFIFLFYTLFKQSLLIFLISLGASILCIYFNVRILKRANKQVEKLYDTEYEYSSMYNDFVSNIRTVKLLSNNNYFIRKINKVGNNCYRENSKYVFYYSFEELVRNTLIIVPFFLGLIKAVMDLSVGIDTIGIITFYISLHVEMGFVFEELSKTIINWFELGAITKKLKTIFKDLDNRPIKNEFNKLELSNVVITYPKTNLKIKVHDFTINKNDKISIMGQSGQGKTSLINLLIGNISTYSGNYVIDEVSINDVKLDMGIVSQEIELFNMSIKENLCLNKRISDKEIKKYLLELELNELLTFQDGILTLVGEKGLKLSTGQKRRINILRSYLLDKDIYILDEPTSNLDKHTEDVVVNFILKYFQNKTLVIVTHNDKINRVCNKFYQFENHVLKKIDK